jgi:PKD domain
MTALRRSVWSRTAARKAPAVAATALGVVLFGAAGFAAATPIGHPRSGKVPGFPRARGLIPVLSSPAAVSAHEALVREAFAAARANAKRKHAPATPAITVANPEALPPCSLAEEQQRSQFTQAVCYHGGPVLHDPKIRLIFWQGPPTTSVEPFTTAYKEVVERYFEDIANESAAASNVFGIDPQYFEIKTGTSTRVPGEDAFSFKATPEYVAEDTERPFTSECSDSTPDTEGPCLLDSEIRAEVAAEITKKETEGWKGESLENVYLVLTPKGVGGCLAGAGCADAESGYCAYHGDFGGNGDTVGEQTLYADLPFVGGISGCDSGVHPNEVISGKAAAGADAVIDDASHELNETVTDPIGSQCNEGEGSEKGKILGCEPLSWTDVAGFEIADKCIVEEPREGEESTYGEPLGEVTEGSEKSLYNQEIAGGHYWSQRQWGNEGGSYYAGDEFAGSCEQRELGASFRVASGGSATVPTTFDAEGSGAPGHPPTYWVWNFGDSEEQIATTRPTVSHTYALPCVCTVSVAAYDLLGSSVGHVAKVTIGVAPPPSSPPSTPPTTVTTTTVTATVAAPVAHYSTAQLAAKLGLPRAGAKLAGLGVITFGHGTCPPACSLSGRLTTRVSSVSRHRRVTRTVLIGTVTLKIAPGGTGTIALKLNSNGRSLLRSRHRLATALALSVTGREGGSWQLTRSFTLTASGGSSARAHHTARPRRRG